MNDKQPTVQARGVFVRTERPGPDFTVRSVFYRRSDGITRLMGYYRNERQHDDLVDSAWEELNRLDPETPAATNADAVARALTVMEAGCKLAEEPRAYNLFNERGERDKANRVYRGKERVTKRYNADVCSQGRVCANCGAQFVPKNIRVKRCPACLEAAKRAGA